MLLIDEQLLDGRSNIMFDLAEQLYKQDCNT
jgi:hypothetical protein